MLGTANIFILTDLTCWPTFHLPFTAYWKNNLNGLSGRFSTSELVWEGQLSEVELPFD